MIPDPVNSGLDARKRICNAQWCITPGFPHTRPIIEVEALFHLFPTL